MDQASVERGSGAKRVFIWRYASEKLKEDFIRPRRKGKDLTVMIQAAVCRQGHSPIVVMKRDPQAPKKGYSANSWRWAMEEMLPKLPQDGFYLLQDNAPIQNRD